MALKKISLVYEGEDYLIDAALDALAITAGWTEDSEESKEAYAKKYVTDYIRAVVQQYNIRQAEIAASTAAREASLQALDAIAVKLEVE